MLDHSPRVSIASTSGLMGRSLLLPVMLRIDVRFDVRSGLFGHEKGTGDFAQVPVAQAVAGIGFEPITSGL